MRTIISPPSECVGINVLIQANCFGCLVTTSRCCFGGGWLLLPWADFNLIYLIVFYNLQSISGLHGWRPEWFLYSFISSPPWLLVVLSPIFYICSGGRRRVRHIVSIYYKKTQTTPLWMSFLPFKLYPSSPQSPIFSHFLIWDDLYLVPLGSQLSRKACGMGVGRVGKHKFEDHCQSSFTFLLFLKVSLSLPLLDCVFLALGSARLQWNSPRKG